MVLLEQRVEALLGLVWQISLRDQRLSLESSVSSLELLPSPSGDINRLILSL